MPSTIERMHREFKDGGLAIVAINIEESRATVAAWVKEKKVTFPVLLDPRGEVTERYGVSATPTAFIVRRDGKLAGKAIGTKEWDSAKGKALLRALLAP